MPELTRQQKKDYLASPVHCPLCNSQDIEGETVRLEEWEIAQPVKCNSCGCEWDDIYKLREVKITHDPSSH